MKERLVAIYARVSTEHEAQISALENQVQYYDNLFQYHPEWKLYKRYIMKVLLEHPLIKDRVSSKWWKMLKMEHLIYCYKRGFSFCQKYCWYVTTARTLKKYGVEVYFTEDNIWTMNDEDGELRLTIMATLAQNESKKTSVRVKAGQKFPSKMVLYMGKMLLQGNFIIYLLWTIKLKK